MLERCRSTGAPPLSDLQKEGSRLLIGSKRIFTESRTLSEHRVEKWRWLKIAAGYQAAE